MEYIKVFATDIEFMATPIGIFRNTLLPLSETFIYEQARFVERFEVHFLGREQTDRFPLTHVHCHASGAGAAGRVRGIAYTLTARSRPLLRAVRRTGMRLIHAHFGVDGLYALDLARRAGIPLLTTFHGFDATRSGTALLTSGKPAWIRYLLGRRRLAREGAHFIAVSGFIRDRLVRLGFPPSRVTTLYIGIDTEKFAPPSGARPTQDRCIVTVGRLVEKKGTAYLVDALARIAPRFPDLTCKVIGDGPLRGDLERRAGSLGLGDRIRFLGFVDNDEVRDHLRRATLFCLPSVTARDGDAEGLGMVLLEAGACGVPLVGTRHGGIPEVIRDGESGLLVPERDPEALAAALSEILSSESLRRRMGVAARRDMEERFDIRTQTRRLEEIYGEIIRMDRG